MSNPPSNYDELSLRSAMTSTVRSFNTSFPASTPIQPVSSLNLFLNQNPNVTAVKSPMLTLLSLALL